MQNTIIDTSQSSSYIYIARELLIVPQCMYIGFGSRFTRQLRCNNEVLDSVGVLGLRDINLVELCFDCICDRCVQSFNIRELWEKLTESACHHLHISHRSDIMIYRSMETAPQISPRHIFPSDHPYSRPEGLTQIYLPRPIYPSLPLSLSPSPSLSLSLSLYIYIY